MPARVNVSKSDKNVTHRIYPHQLAQNTIFAVYKKPVKNIFLMGEI
ncbi:hypothetical protein [Litoribacter populi]|nr:hypothetical protein [Litoribacter populi]